MSLIRFDEELPDGTRSNVYAYYVTGNTIEVVTARDDGIMHLTEKELIMIFLRAMERRMRRGLVEIE